MVCASRVSSALVGAFNQRNRTEPSERSTYTPSRNSKWMLRLSADPNRWIGMTAPLAGEPDLPDQVRGDAAVDVAKHLAHDTQQGLNFGLAMNKLGSRWSEFYRGLLFH
jgi:hypothetical protein